MFPRKAADVEGVVGLAELERQPIGRPRRVVSHRVV
jgi:hypothetical protein